MAKGKRARPSRNLTRKQLSRRRREAQQLRWIWIGVGTMAALVVAILCVGLVLQTTRAVAVVNDQPVRVSDYQRRLRFWVNYYEFLAPGTLAGLQEEQKTAFYRDIADQLIEERLVRQEAGKVGLTVSEERIQVEIEETWFQHYRTPPTPTPSPSPDPQATPTAAGTPLPTPTLDTVEAFQSRYQEFVDTVLKPARVKEADFRRLVEASLLRGDLQAALVPTVPAEEDQVHFRYTNVQDAEEATLKIAELRSGVAEQVQARHILVDTAPEAQAVLSRLQDGEDFAALAAELSTDQSNKDQA